MKKRGKSIRGWVAGLPLCVAIGCGADASEATQGTPTGQTGASGGEADTALDTDEQGSEAGTGGRLDVGGDESLGCGGVEFLFVIDNSSSMEDEQQNLIASFGGFMATIENTVAVEEARIMVVQTGMARYTEGFLDCENMCFGSTSVCEIQQWGGVFCDDLPEVPSCEAAIGAGRVNRKGYPYVSCGLPESRRFLELGEPGLEESFACIADVGIEGDAVEQPIRAMLDALTTEADDCNIGFSQENALLVVTLITDEEEGLASSVEQWRDQLIATRGGNESAVVVLGLVSDAGTPGAVCSALDESTGAGGAASPRLRAFVESFGERGVLGSVCAPDYTEFFAQAVGTVDLACDNFVPEG